MPSPLSGKTMILGVGAQKAGTSWLFNCAATSAQVSSTPIKEIHFFDEVHRPELFGDYADAFRDRLARREKRVKRANDPVAEALRERIAMNGDPQAYLRYFARRIDPERPFFIEITPSYALIGAEGFAAMRDALASAGVTPKLVFLMRDPVDRYWSALRMRARNNAQRERAEFRPRERFLPFLDNVRFVERSRYELTVRALDAAFPPDAVHYGFYEELFRPEAIAALGAFLGIDDMRPDFGREVNVSPPRPLPAELAAAARARFDETYRFVRDRFGDRVPESWLP